MSWNTLLRLSLVLILCIPAGRAVAVAPIPGDTNRALDLSSIELQDNPVAAALDSLSSAMLYGVLRQSFDENDSLLLPAEPIIFPDSVYQSSLAELNRQSPMALQYHPVVKDFIHLYVVKRPEQVSRMMGLAQYYFPLFESTLDRYNMPLELKYLAVVESALNPTARSHAGAHGLWQFIYSTGQLQGLKTTSYYDERHDPILATDAACRYLTKLYQIFGDWNLALAAYNSGPGNVSKAIRYAGGKRDYWSIRPFLPRETRSYVPAFIAVNYVFEHAADHGIHPSQIKPSYFHTDTVMVKELVSLNQLAALLESDTSLLRFFNPSYRYALVPGSTQKPLPVVIPREKVGLFTLHQDSIYALAAAERAEKDKVLPEFIDYGEAVYHRVARGEVLGLIAERYGVRVSDLRRWNGIRGNMIRVGQRLKVYPRQINHSVQTRPKAAPPKAATTAVDKTTSSAGSSAGAGAFQTYQVQPGESFYSIARQYPGVSAENIMGWNDYRRARDLKPGVTLKIYPQNDDS